MPPMPTMTPTPGGPPTAGMTPQPSPTPAPPPGQGTSDPNFLKAIIQKIASLMGGDSQPGIVPQHTNQLNAYLDPEKMNPQGTPMPGNIQPPTPTPGSGPVLSGLPPIPGMPSGGMPHPSPITPPHLADGSKRIGGEEMAGRKGGVLGLKQKNPMGTAKKASPKKSTEEA